MSLLATEASGFHVPPLDELFNFPAFLFEDSEYFAFNRTALLYVLAMFISVGLLWAAFAKPKVVPGKFQAAMEAIVDFVSGIGHEVIGHQAKPYIPFLTSLFLFVWINNLYEILPFVNFPSTGRMALPAFLAIVVYVVYWWAAIKAQGLGYFKHLIVPEGVPKFVLPLYAPIELAQVLIIRPLTLAVRLFANMMAGHILLTILFIAANAFLFDVHDGLANVSFNLKGSPIGLIALLFGPAMVAFELMVGALQAYIFTILAAVYIGSSLSEEH